MFDLKLNLLLISNKAPNLFSVICSEINAASITNITLLQNERGSYRFKFYLKNAMLWEKDFTSYYINLLECFKSLGKCRQPLISL